MATSTPAYELRIYHVVPGKMEDLVSRFWDHTMKLFADRGIKSVAYWTALDEPVKSSTFFYILEHPSREAAEANWKSFQAIRNGRGSKRNRKRTEVWLQHRSPRPGEAAERLGRMRADEERR